VQWRLKMVGVVKWADEKEIIIVPTMSKARLEHHFRRQKIGLSATKWFSAKVFRRT
jgi:hypothetical protein